MRQSQRALERKLNKLGRSIDSSMEAWSNTPEAQALQKSGMRFFQTKIDTPQMRRVDQRNERVFNDLVGSVNGSDYDLDTRGQDSFAHIGNKEIIASTANDIKNQRLAEKLVNSNQGQQVIRDAAAAASNPQANVVGLKVETGIAEIVAHPDPKGWRQFQRDMSQRANKLGRSIQQEIEFMMRNIDVTDTDALETPAAQKIFREANAGPQFKNPF